MDLPQLKGFLEIAKEGSFTRAAANVYLSQPALSLQMKKLEEDLGAKLMERTRRGIRLTPAGELLCQRAKTALGELSAARAEIMELGEVVSGRVVVGTSETNCTYVLPDALRTFRERYPRVQVEVRTKMSSEVGRLVAEDEADFGLATLPVRTRDLVTEPLFQRQDVLICPLGHPLEDRSSVRLQTVAKLPLLALEHGSKSRDLLEDAFKRAEVEPEVAMDFGSLEVIKQFVEIGFGVAIVPRAAIRRELEDGRLSAIAVRGLEKRTVGIIHRHGRSMSRAANELSTLIREQLAGMTM